MTILRFRADDVRRVVEHSLASPKQSKQLVDYRKGEPVYAEVEAPAVCLVHDHGVYLMSNGDPRDIEQGDRSFCAYALGCHPEKDGDWWETARGLVGGDDFGEVLPWARAISRELLLGPKFIEVEINGSQIKLLTREAA